MTKTLRSVEICAGGGGQALGLEQAGFHHEVLIELEGIACDTLLFNRPHWNVINGDIKSFHGNPFDEIDLLAGGVPCPPFSKAGKQLGVSDERDLFPEALRLIKECCPKVVLLENVRGLLDPCFADYRKTIIEELDSLGYHGEWKLLNASDFGVPQLRPRAILIATKKSLWKFFQWPTPTDNISPKTVGDTLYDLMGENGWKNVDEWAKNAQSIAPTLVGGSKKHGGPDLGPTRARKAWETLHVDGGGLANEAPHTNFIGMPRLTTRMTARIQGFPDEWIFSGGKTATYRQIGNAFPPPVAKAIGKKLVQVLMETA